MEVGAGSPDGYNKCPENSRRIVNGTKLTLETEDRNRPLRNRTAGGVGGEERRLSPLSRSPMPPVRGTWAVIGPIVYITKLVVRTCDLL